MPTIPRDLNSTKFLLVIQQNSLLPCTTLSNTGKFGKTSGIWNSSLLVPTFLSVVLISTLHEYYCIVSY